jgi:hypothetical protein
LGYGFYLIKFIEEKYVDNFLNKGEIHFEPLQFFKNLEDNDGDHVIGDSYEGATVFNFSRDNGIDIFLREYGDTNPPIRIEDANGRITERITKELRQKIGASCFGWLYDEDFFLFDEKESSYKLSSDTLSRLNSFNYSNRVPVIIRADIFLQKLGINAVEYGNVRYYDENNMENAFGYDSLVFNKRMKYSSQQEFRLARDISLLDEYKNLYLGDMNNFAVGVENLSEFKYKIEW